MARHKVSRREDSPHTGLLRFRGPIPPEALIAKNRNTYAKRQREQDKRHRAEKKREKRDQKKMLVGQPVVHQSEALPAQEAP
jgi:hypothetical protein